MYVIGECQESEELDQFPIIAGAKWEFTNNWDCGSNDLGSKESTAWGNSGAVDERRWCAETCLADSRCVAFNYPLVTNQKCWWKHTYEKNTILGKDCGGQNSDWQYYTVLERTPSSCTPGGINLDFNTSTKYFLRVFEKKIA